MNEGIPPQQRRAIDVAGVGLGIVGVVVAIAVIIAQWGTWQVVVPWAVAAILAAYLAVTSYRARVSRRHRDGQRHE